MPWSGGSFTRTNGVHTGATLWAQDRDAGTKILAARHDTHDQDLAGGINSTLEKSGSNAATGNLNIGSNRLTAVADGTAKTDAATVNQIQSNGPAYQATDTGTANAHVIALSPAITAYASGQKITFKSGSANTTASTLNVNGLGVKAIKKLHDQDVASGDIESGSIVTVVYDGTNFQMTSQVAAAGASGAPAAATSAKTAAYTVVAGDAGSTILCSAASADYAVALTAAGTLGDGFTVTLKKSDATKFMITINPNSTETIDGLLDLKLRNEHSEATLICDGSNWHIVSTNVAVANNVIENPAMLVDQYGHVTRTGLAANVFLLDRWKFQATGSSSARYTMSVASGGGIDGKSSWQKYLCTTADASPGANEGNYIQQAMIGNNGQAFLGTDGFFENGVLSMDMIVHADGASSISFPAKVALTLATQDGTARQFLDDVSIAAADTWQRVNLVIPEDGTSDIDPGITAQWSIRISLGAGSLQRGTAGSWATGNGTFVSANTDNIADATNNYLGFTNVVLSPGQIPPSYADVARTYEEEFNICEYYFQKFSLVDGTALCIARNESTVLSVGNIFFHNDMRAAPTIVTTGTATDYKVHHSGTTDTVCSAVPSIYYGGQAWGTSVFFRVASGLVIDEPSQNQGAAADSFLGFSAEI